MTTREVAENGSRGSRRNNRTHLARHSRRRDGARRPGRKNAGNVEREKSSAAMLGKADDYMVRPGAAGSRRSGTERQSTSYGASLEKSPARIRPTGRRIISVTLVNAQWNRTTRQCCLDEQDDRKSPESQYYHISIGNLEVRVRHCASEPVRNLPRCGDTIGNFRREIQEAVRRRVSIRAAINQASGHASATLNEKGQITLPFNSLAAPCRQIPDGLRGAQLFLQKLGQLRRIGLAF
jgi:hypothetical protein